MFLSLGRSQAEKPSASCSSPRGFYPRGCRSRGGCREGLASPRPPPERAGVPRLLLAPWPEAFPVRPYLSCTRRRLRHAGACGRRVWRAAFVAPAQTWGRRFVNPAGPQLENNCKIPHRLPPSSFPGLPRGPCRAVSRPCPSTITPPAPRARGLKPFGDSQPRSSGWQSGRETGFTLAPFRQIIFFFPFLFTKSSRKLFCSCRSCEKAAFSNPGGESWAKCDVTGSL